MARKKAAAATRADESAALSGSLALQEASESTTVSALTRTISSTSAECSGFDIVAASNSMKREVIKVNNMNMKALKNACDDAVKKLLSQPGLFIQDHTHTDVKLSLGWVSVLIAGATALYGWRVEFERSRPLVLTGVILYMILISLSILHSFFFEKTIVFVGRRKMLAERTETLTVFTHTDFPSTVPAKGASHQSPRYCITVQYSRSSNSETSLCTKRTVNDVKGYNEFFDEAGTMYQERFEKWLANMVQ